MGFMEINEPKMADAFGIPEYFATHVKVEDAGGGCLRIYNCALRGGLLIPQYTVVFPAVFLISVSKKVEEASHQVYLRSDATAH